MLGFTRVSRCALRAVLAVSCCMIEQQALAQGAPKMGGTLTVASYSDTPIPDPIKTLALMTHTVLKHVCENLVTFDDDFNLIPQLADKWSVDDAGTSYTFTLRKGVKFHNGKELQSEDVKYSLERAKQVAPNRGDFADITSVDATDPHTFVIRLSRPSPVFLTALAGPFIGYIVPKDLDKEQGGEIAKPVCTGPYEWVEWQPDRLVRLRKYNAYAADQRFQKPTGLGGKRTAMVNEIVFRVVPDRSSRVTGLKTGELDFSLRLDVNDYRELKKERQATAIATPVMEWTVLWFGLNTPSTKEVKFREAVAAAIDYQELLQIAVEGHGVINAAFMHPSQKAWRTDRTAVLHQYDPKRAAALLKEVGYKGEPVELYATRDVEYLANTALALQQQLGKLGIKVDVKYLDMGGLSGKVYAKAPDYQLGLMSSSGRFDPDQHYYRRLHSSTAVNKYSNPEYDRVVEEARVTMDQAKRKVLYDQAQAILMRDIPAILLFNPEFFDGARSYVKGFVPSSIGMPRFWDVWLDK